MGLRQHDLEYTIDNVFEIDSYKSKMGEDSDIVTLSFAVKGDQAVLVGQNTQGNDGKTNENNPCIGLGCKVQFGAPGLRPKSKGLESARDPMSQMPAKQKHAKDVSGRDPVTAKTGKHHRVDVMNLLNAIG